MQLSFQSFTTTVQNMAAAVQGACSQLIDLTVGSPLLAILQSVGSAIIWLQWLIAQVYSMTRLATSVGTDVDSWVADFDLTRLPAVAATGQVTFSRFSNNGTALVPVGALVKTLDGTQSFAVLADATQATWNAGLNGYLMPATVSSAVATVQAQNGGTQGNVQAGAIGLIATAISGVDTVTNTAAFTNGINAESDAALRARFSNYIQTLSRATVAAISTAIESVQQGLTFQIYENTDSAGDYRPGNFLVVVDDGSGATPTNTVNAVSAAIAPVRPIGSTWAVQAATDTVATVALTITTNPAGNKPNLITPVATAITAFIEALPVGSTLYFNRIASIAYATDPTITDVSAVTLNSATADLAPGPYGVVRAGSVTVS